MTTVTCTPAGGWRPDLGAAFRRYRLDIVRFVASQVRRGDRGEVDDLVQVTFLRAWRSLPGFRGRDEEQLRMWLIAIARRVVCDHYRAAARRVGRSAGPDDPVWFSAAAAHVDDADRVCRVVDMARSMGAATAEHRCAVRLRVIEGRSWAQTAAEMRRGKAAVRRFVGEVIDP